ncbi:MAG: hypothetical protein LBQ30_04735 [Treponema sp.]|nr:hypothetical protein [Treponema sp.]
MMGIPSDNQIRTRLDGIEPPVLGEVFKKNLSIAEGARVIERYRVKGKPLLVEEIQIPKKGQPASHAA